jgi:hypothetical protein
MGTYIFTRLKLDMCFTQVAPMLRAGADHRFGWSAGFPSAAEQAGGENDHLSQGAVAASDYLSQAHTQVHEILCNQSHTIGLDQYLARCYREYEEYLDASRGAR